MVTTEEQRNGWGLSDLAASGRACMVGSASFFRAATARRSTWGEDLRRAVAVDYVAHIDELLDLALQPAPRAAGNLVATITP